MTVQRRPPGDLTKQLFKSAGNATSAWFMSADHLLAGARVLILELRHLDMDLPIGSKIPQEAKLLPSAFLLYGFALENLLKALWLKHGNMFVVDDKFVGIKGISGHDLPKLAQVTNFSVNEEEKLSLSSLHIKLVSSARYPIGKDLSKHCFISYPNGGFGSNTPFNSGDISIIECMVGRLIKELGYDGESTVSPDQILDQQ